ncbi:hypothetical protein GCM10009700_34690 [Brevibacterium sanguinis]|uniref:hypothetical protein n=1 Tax=Brevibacterium sanguinis TaxID=232444 RepID=UPI0031D1E63A
MSDDHLNDDVERFIITNLTSKYDLDSAFRTDDDYLARGPFKIHSPDTKSWRWGYRLEQVGDHLVFQDGSSFGRTIMSDAVSIRASDNGSIIWLFGFEGSKLTVFTLTAATLEDYRQSIPTGIAVTSFDDGARVVMAELETKRRAQFGLDFDPVLTGRLGLVFRDDSETTTIGLYRFEPNDRTLRRADDKWLECDFDADTRNIGENVDVFLAPFLDSGVASFDAASEHGHSAVPLHKLNQFVFPQFDIDGPEDWNELFNEWDIVS